jgi:hypothetical protein
VEPEADAGPAAPRERRLVFLGPAAAAGAPPRAGLLHEGAPLAPGAALRLRRRRSPWSAGRESERVIAGTSPARADILLAGEGILPEHLRLYFPRAGPGPADLLPIHPGSVRVNGAAVAPREWTALRGGEEIELGPWRFRYEQA